MPKVSTRKKTQQERELDELRSRIQQLENIKEKTTDVEKLSSIRSTLDSLKRLERLRTRQLTKAGDVERRAFAAEMASGAPGYGEMEVDVEGVGGGPRPAAAPMGGPAGNAEEMEVDVEGMGGGPRPAAAPLGGPAGNAEEMEVDVEGMGGGPRPAAAPQGGPVEGEIGMGVGEGEDELEEEDILKLPVHDNRAVDAHRGGVFRHSTYPFTVAQKRGLATSDTIHDVWGGFRNKKDSQAEEIRTATRDAFTIAGVCPTIEIDRCLTTNMPGNVLVSQIEDTTVRYFEENTNGYISPMLNNAHITYQQIIAYEGDISVKATADRALYDTLKISDPDNSIDADLSEAHRAKICKYILVFLLGNSEANTYITFDAAPKIVGDLFKNHETVSGLIIPQNIGDSASTSIAQLGKYKNQYYFPADTIDGVRADVFTSRSNTLSESTITTYYRNNNFEASNHTGFSFGIQLKESPAVKEEISYGKEYFQGPSLDYLLELMLLCRKNGDLRTVIPSVSCLRIGDIIEKNSVIKKAIQKTGGGFFLDVKRQGDQDACYGALKTLLDFIQDGKGDFVIFCTIDRLCALLARLLGLPCIWHFDNEITLYKNKQTDRELSPEQIRAFQEAQNAKFLEEYTPLYDFFCTNRVANKLKLDRFITSINTTIDPALSPLMFNRIVDIHNYMVWFKSKWDALPVYAGPANRENIDHFLAHFIAPIPVVTPHVPVPAFDKPLQGLEDQYGEMNTLLTIFNDSPGWDEVIRHTNDAARLNIEYLTASSALKKFETASIEERRTLAVDLVTPPAMYRKNKPAYTRKYGELARAVEDAERRYNAASALASDRRAALIQHVKVSYGRNITEDFIEGIFAATYEVKPREGEMEEDEAEPAAQSQGFQFDSYFLKEIKLLLEVDVPSFNIDKSYSILQYNPKQIAELIKRYNETANALKNSRVRTPEDVDAIVTEFNTKLENITATFFDKVHKNNAYQSIYISPRATSQFNLRFAQAVYIGYKLIAGDNTAAMRDPKKTIEKLALQTSSWLRKAYLSSVRDGGINALGRIQRGGAYDATISARAFAHICDLAGTFINAQLCEHYPVVVKRYAIDMLVTHLNTSFSKKNKTYLLCAYDYAKGAFHDSPGVTAVLTEQQDAINGQTMDTKEENERTNKERAGALRADGIIAPLIAADPSLEEFVKKINPASSATLVRKLSAYFETTATPSPEGIRGAEYKNAYDATILLLNPYRTDRIPPPPGGEIDFLARDDLIEGINIHYPLFRVDEERRAPFIANMAADTADMFTGRLSAYALITLAFIDDLLKKRVGSRTSLLMSRAAGVVAPAGLERFSLEPEVKWERIPDIIRDLLIQIQSGRLSTLRQGLLAGGARRTPRKRHGRRRTRHA